MEDIFSGKYEDRVDWTHLNTVSYQSETDTIVISPRNLESVVKLNWTTKGNPVDTLRSEILGRHRI